MAKLSRLVLNFPGFEATNAAHQIERLTAGSQKTATVWNFQTDRKSLDEQAGEHKAVAEFSNSGKGWKTHTRYVQFEWSDIVDHYEAVPYPFNLVRHLPDYLRFFLDGTVWKYFAASGRYFGFTVYPIIYMIACFILPLLICMAFGMHWLASLIIALIALVILTKFPGDRLYVSLSINDWAFARDLALQRNPEIEERYNIFAKHVIDEISRSDADEILIVGHSFGSVWAIEALSRAMADVPELLHGKRITFLALGSSLMKIGLVDKAHYLRSSTEKLLAVKNLTWHEIQTKTDFISFYKSDPFEPMGIKNYAASAVVHRVNFKHALSKERHKKMKKSMYLAHRQYILYCDKQVHHDFQLRVFGPFFADALANDVELALHSKLVN